MKVKIFLRVVYCTLPEYTTIQLERCDDYEKIEEVLAEFHQKAAAISDMFGADYDIADAGYKKL